MAEEKTKLEPVRETDSDIVRQNQNNNLEPTNRVAHRGRHFASSMWAIAVIVFLLVASGIWYVVRSTRIQDTTEARVENHIDNLEFDDARDDAARLTPRGTGLLGTVQMWFEQRRETARINRKEAENLKNNGITPGHNQKQFVGMTGQAAKQELVKRGFKTVRIIEMYDTSRKYKNKEAGTVISISINGEKRFKAMGRFRDDSIVEIYVLAKENRDELEDMITIGCSNKDFVGLAWKEAVKRLKQLGFDEKRIIKTEVVDNSKKYKEMEEGTVIKIIINGDSKFKAKDRFPKASSIEIQYLGKP